jgi:hypothetical protein
LGEVEKIACQLDKANYLELFNSIALTFNEKALRGGKSLRNNNHLVAVQGILCIRIGLITSGAAHW